MSLVQELHQEFSSLLQLSQKYISAITSSQQHVKSLNNLGEQLQSTETISADHPILLQQPEVIDKLVKSINLSIADQFTDLQAAM